MRVFFAPLLLCAWFIGDAANHAAGAAVFSSYALMALRLEAPLDDLFAQGRRNTEYAVDGVLIDPSGKAEPYQVKVALRGHTSLRDTECTFPKLKLTFKDAPGDSSPFGGMKVLKIGTHCGESTDETLTPKFGRLPNERAPLRESFVYRLLDVLGVPSLRARPARITYVYTDGRANAEGGAQHTLTRNALILEDDDDLVKRLGGEREIKAEAFTTGAETFSVEDLANVAFAEALIGNFDWCLKFTATDRYRCDARMKLWNVTPIALASGKARAAIYDFDVSGMVAGGHRWFKDAFNVAFVSSRSPREVEVLAQVQRTRSLFGRADLDGARRRFMQRKDAAYAALGQAELDASGREHIREYMDAFFREIASDEAFYRPVVTTSVPPRATPDNGSIVCSSRGSLPVGTPVSEPLQTHGELVQVVVLDALWHYATPVQCPAMRQSPAWIEASAVSREYPK